MPVRQVPTIILSLTCTVCFCVAARAQQAGRIESMKLLTPNVGWAATNKKLFWTTDGGAQWKDITPKLDHGGQTVSSVFFLDSSTGWVLLKCGDGHDLAADSSCFDLASTYNAGESWSVTHEKIAHTFSREQLDDGYGFSGRSWLDFVDPQHGWEILDISTNSANPSAGEMLRTTDGGKTWIPTKDLPTSDHFIFTTTTDGWIAGGKDQELFVTHDAGDSWQKVSLPKPASVDPDTRVDYDLPVFVDQRHGLLPVRYAVGPLMGPDLTTLAMFVTDDGGRTWKQDRILPRLPDIYSSDVAGSVLIAAHSELTQLRTTTKLSTYTTGPDRSVSSNTTDVPSAGAVLQLSFAGRDQGWANLVDGLFATPDAGKTWLDITPGGRPPSPTPAIQGPSKTVPTRMGGGSVRGPAQQPTSGNQISTHLGFDGYNVPTVAQMATWWNFSPYYDIGVYLPGSLNQHKDPILGDPVKGPAWVSAVQGQGQGWGLIPLWVGLQSSCIIDQPTVTHYFGPAVTDAHTQGKQEADQAIMAAQKLGLATTIIYKDIENYTVNTSCSPLVQAFVDAWDNELYRYHDTLHPNGYLAGVYANAGPINSDISNVSIKIPDDIWVTKTTFPGIPPQVTTWHQGIDDSLWPSSQRVHQFLINPTPQPNATFGGVPLSINIDIENGTIAAGNGIKTHSYNFMNIDCKGAIATYAYGINDMNGGAFINGPKQIGMIVGSYRDSINNLHGFQYNGTCTPIDVSGATSTSVLAINNSGTVVGLYEDSSSINHSFQWALPGGKLDTFACTGATDTFALGINDAGQIAGTLFTNSAYSGFLLYGGPNGGPNCIPIEYTNTSGITQVNGINGDAGIIGNLLTSNLNTYDSLVEYAVPPLWAGNFSLYSYTGASATTGAGINNNNDQVGTYSLSNGSLFGYVLSGSGPPTELQISGSTYTVASGINDFGQVVGYYTDAKGVSHGFLATPQ